MSKVESLKLNHSGTIRQSQSMGHAPVSKSSNSAGSQMTKPNTPGSGHAPKTPTSAHGSKPGSAQGSKPQTPAAGLGSKTPTHGSKTPTAGAGHAPKTPMPGQHPGSKTPLPGSRNGLLPQLNVIKYSIDADVVKCPICLDVYKSPRVLPCGHSVCLECLNNLIIYTDSSKTSDVFQCPVCRKNTKPRDNKLMKQKWACQFPVNSVIVRLLRNASVQNPNDNSIHKAFCEICLMNNKTKSAVAYCNTCLEHHCDVCAKHHERREETKDHEVVSFLPKEDPAEKAQEQLKIDYLKKLKGIDDSKPNDKRVKIDPNITRDGRLLPPVPVNENTTTVTAVDAIKEKHIMKLGHFNGKAHGDTTTSDFRGIAFLTDFKVVLSDHANKKLKVYDVTHKTRVELITDISLRVDPTHICRVDGHTVAVVTERNNTFHVRLFTIRDKIQHFVHVTLDSVPLGIGEIDNTVVCSFLGHSGLLKFKLTRAQQQRVGVIRQDLSGNDIFRHPGAMCSGVAKGRPVIYVADETEYGITVSAVDLNGVKQTSVFFEIQNKKTKSPSKKTNGNDTLKSGRLGKSKLGRSASSSRKDDASDTTNESELERTTKTVKRKSADVKEDPAERLSGRHTFRRVDEYGRPIDNRRVGREIERTPNPGVPDIDIERLLTSVSEDLSDTLNLTVGKSTSRRDGKAVERASARKKPIQKPINQLSPDTKSITSLGKTTNSATNTMTPNSTIGTVTFAAPPKLVYRADSVSVDAEGNVYVCVSSANKVHQMSADGRVKKDLLTEKDGIVAPKVVSFSPSGTLFLVTCLKSNKVSMYRLK